MAHGEKNKEEEEEGAGVVGKLMGTLTVGLIFRHFVSGAVFIGAYYYSRCAKPDELLKTLQESASALAIVGLIAGTLIYALHRAITNPILEWFRHKVMAAYATNPKQFRYRFIFPEKVKDMMFDRWDAGQEYCQTPAHITSWADYVHLQYTTAFALVAGSITAAHFARHFGTLDIQFSHWFCGWYMVEPKTRAIWGWSWPIFLLFLIFLVSGFYTDCRKHAVEYDHYKRLKEEAARKEVGESSSSSSSSSSHSA